MAWLSFIELDKTVVPVILSHKKKQTLIFAATCIDLENIVLTEEKYFMISLICRI